MSGMALRLAGLAVLLALVALWGLAHGALAIPWRAVMQTLLHGVGIGQPNEADQVVLRLRLPRLILSMLVGAALGTSGAVVQGVFRNPLADAGLLGISGGAALGAVAAIVGAEALGHWLPLEADRFRVQAGTLIGGFATTWLVYRLGRYRRDTASLLLAGIAVNAMAGAATGFLTYLANDRQLRDLTFWLMGSLGGASYEQLNFALPTILLALLATWPSARVLNALLLGENEAQLLGFRLERTLPWLILLVAVLVGMAVTVSGGIGFIGLIAPNLLRRLWGADHRWLLPGSALAGAALLTAADTLARTLVAPAELPIGVLTGLLGGPFFLWLLWREGRSRP